MRWLTKSWIKQIVKVDQYYTLRWFDLEWIKETDGFIDQL